VPRFQPGDVVKLKSGGPPMTVECDVGDQRVSCQWFEKNELKQATFAEATLEPSEPRGIKMG
jgi:uncharacterized protein YodC (DUF2158 family)